MVMRIPSERWAAAAQLPENQHARKTLLKLAGQAGGPPSPPPVRQAPEDASVDALRITLPLPPRELHPNARVHWGAKARATKAYRHAAYVAAIDALDARPPPAWERATVQITAYFPDRRRRDVDGLLSSLKAGLDGLSRSHGNAPGALIVVDDSGLSFLPILMEVDRENPRVEVEIARTP